ncbi:MAG: transposase [Solobacterium sp.]|nr:transposase [Solobacterium sp.]
MIDERLYTEYPYYGALTIDDRNYDPDKPRLKDILWKHLDWLEEMDKTGKARPVVLDNVHKTLLCNTYYLGYDGFECPVCGDWNILYRHCHSRFCNSCGIKHQKELASKAEVMCLDVKHRHVVFTIPEQYRTLFRADRESLNLLFVAARNSICKMFNENIYRKEKRKRGKTGKIRNDKDNHYLYRNFKNQKRFGMIASLHTFGRALNWNPHIHCLVAELAYDSKKEIYQEIHHFDYQNLRRTWQYELNRLLLEHFGKTFRKKMNTSYSDYNNGFYVYAKQQDIYNNSSYSKNVGDCVNYMMRYSARPPMAESRIISYDKVSDTVEWFYDDHKTEERVFIKEPSLELLKKMIIHIPDENFRMVRYYGFYNNKEQELLDHLHELIGKVRKTSKHRNERKRQLQQKLNKLKFRTLCMDTYNRDILHCRCGELMVYVDSYNPLDGISNDRQYRQNCINEMRNMWLRRKSPPQGHQITS